MVAVSAHEPPKIIHLLLPSGGMTESGFGDRIKDTIGDGLPASKFGVKVPHNPILFRPYL